MPVQLALFPDVPGARRAMPRVGLSVASLQSGSEGNATLVAGGKTAILVDCGLSPARLRERLAGLGRRVEDLAGALVTHEHADHAGGCALAARRLGLPLYMTEGTAAEASKRILRREKDRARVRILPPSGSLAWKDGAPVEPSREHDLRAQWIPVPHDAEEPVAFVLERAGVRVGFLTDLGHASRAVRELVGTLDAALIEANHDPGLLRDGPYPDSVKRRIASSVGHLSNEQVAKLVRDHAGARLRVLLLGHLSRENNSPELALAAVREALARRGDLDVDVRIASRDGASAVIEL
ncbi:MBL fold metallo-hydrolase [bacterium]|nr:MBL fold metallo-hydrolase [bacterium]